ncbi:hypothetical protein AAG607_13575 [Citromicrobium bathyomarinum]|uniref:hypothetical protein n=1 Tax=Citromicrobium bathyomarinum TaxID=72174 RepID=UPI00315A12CC
MSWSKHKLIAADAQAVLHELCPVGGGEMPVELLGWRDRRGNLRRAQADYPNGWRLVVHFTLPKGGQQTMSSYTATLKVSAEPSRGAA